jgi:PAS domain S-box-containing protein
MRLAFLADATSTFASSLSFDVTAESLAGALVPAMADWCTVRLVDDDGRVTRATRALADEAKDHLMAELERRFPPDRFIPDNVRAVLATQVPQLDAVVTEASLTKATVNPDQLGLIKELGIASSIVVPLVTRGRALGALTLVRSTPDRPYTVDDLALAEELARRAALALDNARLFEQVQEAGHRFRTLVQRLHAILWEAEADPFRFTFVSRGAEEMLGYPIGDWTGDPDFWSRVVHPEDLDWVLQTCLAAIGEGRDHQLEFRAVAADGQVLWLREMVDVECDRAGRPLKARGLILDITDRQRELQRKAAEHATTEALAQSTSIEEAAPRILQGVAEAMGWDTGTLYLIDERAGHLACQDLWHRAAAELGPFAEQTRTKRFASGDALPGRPWASGNPEWIEDVREDPDFSRAAAAREAGLRGGFAFPITIGGRVIGVMEFLTRDPGVNDPDLVATAAILGSQIGQFIERTRAERARLESEARTSAILEAALDCVITLGADGRVVDWNPAAERTFGYSRDEAVGSLLSELIIPPAFAELHESGLARFRATGEAPIVGERLQLPARRRDGSEFPAELTITRVRLNNDTLFTGYLRDITDRTRTEEALRRSEKRFALLAEASNLLATSLDYASTLNEVTRLAVPELADWCLVDVLADDGSIVRMAVAHADPTTEKLVRRLRPRYPVMGDAPRGVAGVLDSGQPELYESVTPEVLADLALDGQNLATDQPFTANSAMCVPMIARGRTLGVITYITAESGRVYAPSDLRLAQDLAQRGAFAVDNARMFEERAHVARTLQHSLLPPSLPEIPGIDVVGRYHPAGEGTDVGGDFYDMFQTGRSSWAVAIGDVCGKGAEAAAVTALARYTLRTAAMQERSPSKTLATLNEAILRNDQNDRFCTALFGRIERRGDGARVTLACGGHPLPYLVRRDRTVHKVGKGGTALGLFPDAELADQAIDLRPGDMLVMYTDGVPEARTQTAIFGEGMLGSMLGWLAGKPADEVADHIVRTCVDFQKGRATDDIAVVVIRVPIP